MSIIEPPDPPIDLESEPELEPVTSPPAADPLELGATGRQMFANTEPAAYADTDTGHAWRRFIGALSELLDPIASVTRPADGSERWTTLGSPTRCPPEWLPVLAQWAGVRRPESMSEEDLRELIGPRAPGMWRGTKAAMIAAARRFLPEGVADQFIYFEERADGDPYKLRVFTYRMHTPPEVEEQIRDTLEHAKPAGLNPFIYEVRVGQSWDMLRRRCASWVEVRDRYENWREVHHDEPLP